MASAATVMPSHSEEGLLSDAARAGAEDSRRAELLAIVKARSFKTGIFRLSSGKESHLYFNMKPTMMDPRGAELSARAFLDMIASLNADFVSGLEMGAVPVIGSMAALSSAEGRPLKTTFVRKQAKAHGTRDVIEGLGPDETLVGKHVVVIDDVATSGKSILQAIDEVRAIGGIVEHAACIVNRGEGGAELMEANGVKLHSIFHANDFVPA